MARSKTSRKSPIKKRKPNKRVLEASPSKKVGKPKPQKRDVDQAGLNPKKFSRIKQEFHDIDYADKLSPEDRDYLHRFMEEDLGARMNHDGKKIYRKTKDKRASYQRNNKRNWDVYGLGKVQGKIILDDAIVNISDKIQNLETTNPEDAMIENIDLKNTLKKP